MLTPIPRDARTPLAPLFEGFLGLRGVLHAILEGTIGEFDARVSGVPALILIAVVTATAIWLATRRRQRLELTEPD